MEYEGKKNISGGRGINKQKGTDTLVNVLRRKLRYTRKRERYGVDQEDRYTKENENMNNQVGRPN